MTGLPIDRYIEREARKCMYIHACGGDLKTSFLDHVKIHSGIGTAGRLFLRFDIGGDIERWIRRGGGMDMTVALALMNASVILSNRFFVSNSV